MNECSKNVIVSVHFPYFLFDHIQVPPEQFPLDNSSFSLHYNISPSTSCSLSLTWHRGRWARLCWGWWHRTRKTGRPRTGSCPLEGPKEESSGTEHPLLFPKLHFLWPRSLPCTPGTQKSEERKITNINLHSVCCLYISVLKSSEIQQRFVSESVSHPQHQCIHQSVYTGPLELSPSAVLHQFGIRTWDAPWQVKMKTNHTHTHIHINTYTNLRK